MASLLPLARKIEGSGGVKAAREIHWEHQGSKFCWERAPKRIRIEDNIMQDLDKVRTR